MTLLGAEARDTEWLQAMVRHFADIISLLDSHLDAVRHDCSRDDGGCRKRDKSRGKDTAGMAAYFPVGMLQEAAVT